jgi:hypothetical protein
MDLNDPKSSNISNQLRDAVLFVAMECKLLEDDWWIIGSTAALLSGLPHIEPRDVDLLVSARDARRLFARWKVRPVTPASSSLFRSVFGVHCIGNVDIEIMGDLEVRTNGIWSSLKPKSRELTQTDAGQLFIPARDEQISILRLFGRPKDLLRARALEMIQQLPGTLHGTA